METLSEHIVNNGCHIDTEAVKSFIEQLKSGCGADIDVIVDEYGDGHVVFCGERNIEKSTGKEVIRFCKHCEINEEKIDKLAGDKLI